MKNLVSYILRICLIYCLTAIPSHSAAQTTGSIYMNENNTWNVNMEDSVLTAGQILTHNESQRLMLVSDSVARTTRKDWSTWRPNPQRALWLAIVLPGAGQIYNRKYWKLPIVYGGFVGCLYAMRWNNQMFKDYSQAYMDLMDDDPNTQSYNQFLHLGNEINESNIDRYSNLFKKRKDRYRRWRDLSMFALIGVYALSVIDAYVDASLSEFDISKNLSLRVEPVILNSNNNNAIQLKSSSIGVNCSLNF